MPEQAARTSNDAQDRPADPAPDHVELETPDPSAPPATTIYRRHGDQADLEARFRQQIRRMSCPGCGETEIF